ncbi:probable inorganic phosphate transporter 1-9 [Olea europaea subsp. europaea]|uniref:Probable inorganic phosphate transporter 1-9 n=1 Tax=Olea europaea subsp. europaea TaxID=158383 RepID=A0A8S0TD75_OLEEU|nr:probable inorganic phosphate transporter 1-9 [Olea europaea subsp. europaea]
MALKVLSALDSARTQYYHFKAIIVAGMGLFTDAYDLFCIPPIMRLIGRIYYDDRKKYKEDRLYEFSTEVTSFMVGTAILGTVIGQLVFGYLGDRIGRRRVYGLSLMLMVLSSIGCGFSLSSSRTFVLPSLMLFRFMLGLGIGGDYPLSATIMSEFANRKTRGTFIAAVFSMQGFGILVSSTVTMIVCAIFNRASNYPAPDHTPESADLAWRLILMIGAVPAGLTYYWRMMMPETARYTALVERNVIQATKDMQKVLEVSLRQIAEEESLPNPPSYSLFSKEFLRRHGRDLFSCAANWFLVDVVFYSSNLFQSKIYEDGHYLRPKGKVNAFEDAFQLAKLQAIIAICSTIPGYFATVYFIDRVGRVKIQIMGFFFMALGMFAIGIPYFIHPASHANIEFMIFYGLTFFFSNFGPNTTTFIVPAELFPARFRSTCHGISGAAGKVGAIIGSVGFLWASHNQKWKVYTKAAFLVVLGGICILGMIVTYFFTRETKGRSLEENENEDETTGVCILRCFANPCICRQASNNQVIDA